MTEPAEGDPLTADEKRDSGEKEDKETQESRLLELWKKSREQIRELSIHARAAVTCGIVLFTVTVLSSFMLGTTVEELNNRDSSSSDYLGIVADVSAALALELQETQVFLNLGGAKACGCQRCSGCVECTVCEKLNKVREDTNLAMDNLLLEHYKQSLPDLTKEGIGSVHMVGSVFNSLQIPDLNCIRSQVDQETPIQTLLESVQLIYTVGLHRLNTVAGKRVGNKLSPFARTSLAYFGLVCATHFWGDGSPLSAALRESGSNKVLGLQRSSRNAQGFVLADTVLRSLTDLETSHEFDQHLMSTKEFEMLMRGIKEVTKVQQPNTSAQLLRLGMTPPAPCTVDMQAYKLYFGQKMYDTRPFDISGVPLALDNTPAPDAFRNQRANSLEAGAAAGKKDPAPQVRKAGAEQIGDTGPTSTSALSQSDRLRFLHSLEKHSASLEAGVREGVRKLDLLGRDYDGGKERLRRRVACLSLLLLVCLASFVSHSVNVLAYRQSAEQVKITEKENAKLRDSVQRMEEFVKKAEALDVHDLQTKTKGIPLSESFFYQSLPMLTNISTFLPPQLLTEKMRNMDPAGLHRPYTQVGFHAYEDVTLLLISTSDQNAQAPSAQDPVKQKSLENAATKFLSLVESAIEPSGGTVIDVSADGVMVAWNLCGEPQKGTAVRRPQEIAAEIVFKIFKEFGRDAPDKYNSAIVNGQVIGGIAGISTLKRFVVLGPPVHLVRNALQLATHYGLQCMIDSSTDAILSKSDYQTRPVDLITVDIGDQVESRAVLYELYGNRGAARDQDLPGLQHWQRCFQHLLDGEIREASDEIRKYEQKFRPTALTHRFTELLASHPTVPNKQILDFVAGTPAEFKR